MMASPQAEDGHIDVANEIVEALARTNLSAYESRILWALWRKTWGWHRKEERITYGLFSQMTGILRRRCIATLNRLIARNIIIKKKEGKKATWAFQKNYELWSGGAQIGTKVVPRLAPFIVPEQAPLAASNPTSVKAKRKPKERNLLKEKGE